MSTMSKLQRFKCFVNERLAVAALEIFGQYEKDLAEGQEEICRYQEKNARLQRMLDFQPKITDVLKLSLPEPPQIKEEQDLWTSQGEEQLQGLQSDTTDTIFTIPTAETYLHQPPPLNQTPVKNRERDVSTTNTSEEPIKIESDEDDYGEPEPPRTPRPCFVTPDYPTAQSLEEDGGRQPPDLKPIESSRTPATCSRSSSSPGPSPRPVISSCSRSEREHVSPADPERKAAENPYPWGESDRGFSPEADLAEHRHTHTGEHSYQCHECDKAFRRKSNLAQHKKVHTGEKPYQCAECGRAFSNRSNLMEHERIHTGDKPFQCEECSRVFSLKSSLVKHRRIHTGEKPYHCEECDRAFSRNDYLIQHRRTHTAEKPYQCSDCDRAFSQKSNLVKHRRIHIGEMPGLQQQFSHKASEINFGRRETVSWQMKSGVWQSF